MSPSGSVDSEGIQVVSVLAANRVLKASRFAAFIDRHLGDEATAFNVGGFDTAAWEQTTQLMNDESRLFAEQQEDASDLPRGTIKFKTEQCPSYDTRAAVIAIYRFREDRPDNVFSLFPKEQP